MLTEDFSFPLGNNLNFICFCFFTVKRTNTFDQTIAFTGFDDVTDFFRSQIEGCFFVYRFHFALTKRKDRIVSFIIGCGYLFKTCFAVPEGCSCFPYLKVGILFVRLGKRDFLSLAVKLVGPYQYLLHCDGSCFVVADLRIDIPNDIFIELVRNGLLPHYLKDIIHSNALHGFYIRR